MRFPDDFRADGGYVATLQGVPVAYVRPDCSTVCAGCVTGNLTPIAARVLFTTSTLRCAACGAAIAPRPLEDCP